MKNIAITVFLTLMNLLPTDEENLFKCNRGGRWDAILGRRVASLLVQLSHHRAMIFNIN
jgi:hypothetical protein